MKCPTCGNEIPNDSLVCPTCGGVIDKPEAQSARVFIKPDITTIIILALATLTFIFGYLPLVVFVLDMGITSVSESFSILANGYANYASSAPLVIAKIFMLFSIFIFPVFVASKLLNLNKLLKLSLSGSNTISKWAPVVYYGLYAVALLFTLIGVLAVQNFHLAVCWYFALVFSAAGFVVAFMPNLVKNIVGRLQK